MQGFGFYSVLEVFLQGCSAATLGNLFSPFQVAVVASSEGLELPR